MRFKTIVLDYNGTLVNDVDLCHELLNKLLALRGHPSVPRERYLEIFHFPIKDYYRDAGFLLDEGIDDYDALARIFTDDYLERFPECSLFPDVLSTLESLKGKVEILVLSATDTKSLEHELKHYGIFPYLDGFIGITGIQINSKLKEAQDYFSSHPHNMDEALFVGDTDHDAEVAKDLGGKIALISRGHQCLKRLEAMDPDYIFPTLQAMADALLKD